MAYINLFPTYANSEQLNIQNEQLCTKGDTVTAYSDYLRQYLDVVKPVLLSYDHYQFEVTGDTDQYFLNLALIRQAAVQAGTAKLGEKKVDVIPPAPLPRLSPPRAVPVGPPSTRPGRPGRRAPGLRGTGPGGPCRSPGSASARPP